MINLENEKRGKKSALATICASMLTCALAVPAIAIPTTRVAPTPNHPSDAGMPGSSGVKIEDYDHTAPLAGVQYVDDDEAENRGWAEPGDRFRNEEREGRQNLRDSRDKARDQAERLDNKLDQERAEHARHEMREHQAERAHGADED
jgi:hypothetical protein